MHACSRSMGTTGLNFSWGGCSDFWGRTRMGMGMHFPFSFITKRVDVSMGCQRCESHKLVMAAVAEMGPGQSLGHNYIKWWASGMPIRVFFGPGLFAKEIRPRARRFRNPTHVMNCSYGVQLIAAVAAYSWLQSRHAASDYAVASYAARGMSGRAVAACSCVLRRTRFDFTLAS